MANGRSISFRGELKETHSQLKLDDAIDGNLEISDIEKGLREDLDFIIERYSWNVGYSNYIKF